MRVRVALIGCGRWGIRLLSALCHHRHLEVATVVDSDPRNLARATELAPAARAFDAIEHGLAGVEAAIIATPSPLHAAHARAALAAGLDVLVEKPLATTLDDAEALAEDARRTRRVAMVGQVLRYHAGLSALIARARRGELGRLEALQALRFTGSGSPDPLWTLGPHDVSTLVAIDPSPIEALEASEHGGVVSLSLALRSGLSATVDLSTTVPTFARFTQVKGTRASASYDELEAKPKTDPLVRQLDHFAACVRSRRRPRTSFDDAVRVVEVLEQASALLKRGDPLVGRASTHAGAASPGAMPRDRLK
jgi:predicted dehydrogenase